jgi:hypothetical protein
MTEQNDSYVSIISILGIRGGIPCASLFYLIINLANTNGLKHITLSKCRLVLNDRDDKRALIADPRTEKLQIQQHAKRNTTDLQDTIPLASESGLLSIDALVPNPSPSLVIATEGTRPSGAFTSFTYVAATGTSSGPCPPLPGVFPTRFLLPLGRPRGRFPHVS